MKKLMILASAFFLVFGLVGVASAYSIVYGGVDSPLTSSYDWAVVEDFENPNDLSWDWSGSFTIRSGSLISGQSAPPLNDTTNYVSVPEVYNGPVGEVMVTLNGVYDYFGIFWGSVDTYNTLSFYKNGERTNSFTGSDIVDPANGDQWSPNQNLYVNFFGLDFDSFKMASTNMAFEADNIAVGIAPVPEPATMLLLGTGLIGLAAIGRKKFMI